MRLINLILILLMCSSCANTFDRLSKLGKAPPLDGVTHPLEKQAYQQVEWPVTPDEFEYPRPKPHLERQYPNSLWQPGASTFFRDQRARRIGDIVKVVVKISDKADLNNKTLQTRNNTETMGTPALFGFQKYLADILPGTIDPASLLNLTGSRNVTGNGTIARKESIEMQIAGMVTQILPNGNLVIHGSQEVRVNHELRKVTVKGIINPKDISSDNSIQSEQIAQARISYGGEGDISAVQQPRIGSQIVDIISPF